MSNTVSDNEKPSTAHDQISVGSSDTPTFSGIEVICPDGGLQAWGTVLGAFLVQMCTFGNTASFGVYQDFYVRDYIKNASPSAISWVGSFNAFLVVAGGIVSGRLYDQGYFYPLLWGGSLLTSLSLFLHSFAQPNKYYQVFLTQGLGVGLGGALSYVPSLAILSQYFCKRRSLAMSIATVGASVGAIVHPLLLNNLLSNPRFGFANAVRAGAGLQSGLLLFACLLMRSKAPVSGRKMPTLSTIKQLRKMSTDGPFLAATFGFAVFSIGWYFPQFYIQLDATTHGVSQTVSFYSLVIMNVSGVFGRVLPGLLAGVLGVGNMMIAATASCTALIFGMLGLKDAVGVILISILYGFFSGAFGALSSPLVSVLTDDVSELGMRIGVAFFFCGIGGLIGPPLGGALLTSSLVWWKAVLFSGFTALSGTLSFGIMLWLWKGKGRLNHQKTSLAGASAETTKV